MGPLGGEQIERIGDCTGVGQQQCALSEIVQNEARQDHGKPAEPYRQGAEMAHIGVDGLTP
jgi:hypothetical protein